MTPDMFHQIYKSITTGSQFSTEALIPAGRLTREEAMALYQSGYQARLTESLMDRYESVGRFLGDQQFIEICERYIANRESKDANINNYGSDFADFLKTLDCSTDWPFLADLAKLDLIRFGLFHQERASGLDGGSLISQISDFFETDFTFDLTANLEFLTSPFPLFEMWQAIYQGSSFPEPGAFDQQTLMFWKRGSQVFLKPIPSNQFETLQKIRNRMPVLESMSDLQDSEISEIFQFLGEEGLVIAVKSLGK